ncbi:MAG: ATP:cob(I)alamin adenosyltransferase [Candidatus Marinimicrobia bacterium]|nr:ATP:cob(I)alamin adenosyltransferase [Candidatus Neomarinimicrobiota bacterium]
MGDTYPPTVIYNCKLVIFRMRITKVTTKTGDKGETSLGRGERVRKDHPRVNALGDLDYLNSVIGWTVSPFSDSQIGRELKKIQQDIFNISGDISLPDSESVLLKKERIKDIEDHIDIITNKLPPLKEFILPGGSELISRLHIARTSCRNAERSLISMYGNENLNQLHAKYMNRLSDYLFLLARLVKHNEGVKEEHWDLEK